jgi:hypothetical protein
VGMVTCAIATVLPMTIQTLWLLEALSRVVDRGLISYFRASKFIVGTQLGILSVFNRSSGWGDCVDRIPGYVTFFDTEFYAYGERF